MGTAVLVREERELGWDLLESLEEAQYPLQAAFWQYLPESEEWRLFLATSVVEKEGKLQAYRLLQEQMRQMSQDIQETLSPASNITVLRPSDERVKRLIKKYGKVARDRSQFRPTYFGITEDYVYFL